MITFSEFYAVPLDSFLFLRYVVLLTKEVYHRGKAQAIRDGMVRKKEKEYPTKSI